MESECVNFPKLNHEICQLALHEKVAAEYFESRGLIAERLCAVKSSENTPDFRMVGDEGFVCLCEIKKPLSPMGNLTKRDWHHTNRVEFEQWKDEAKKQNVQLIVTSEQLKLANDEVPYSDEVRNTDLREMENFNKIREWLEDSIVAKFPLIVTISRNDIFNWIESELKEFTNDLIEKLGLISRGQIPNGWVVAYHTINGNYRRKRHDGRYIQNQIQVVLGGEKLLLNVQFSLGMNWEAIEENSRKAQKQIKSQLQHEFEPEKVIRLLVMFLEHSLYFQYFSEIDKLEIDINRRVLQKFPELSAIAFCTQPFSSINFMVFHTSNSNIPSLPKNVFDDGNSLQFPNQLRNHS